MPTLQLKQHDQNELLLVSDSISLGINTAKDLQVVSLEHGPSDACLTLAGPALRITVDAAEHRAWIPGWRLQALTDDAGWTDYRFDDADWRATDTLPRGAHGLGNPPIRARTQVFLPKAAAGNAVTLVLGGFGLYDFEHIRVWINGIPAGDRTTEQFWTAPGRFDLSPTTAPGQALRFGSLNTIAVEAHGLVTRNQRLNETDPHCSRHFPGPDVMAPVAEQYLVVGEDTVVPNFQVGAVDDTDGTVIIQLKASDCDLAAQLHYTAGPDANTIHRNCEITNTGSSKLRIMDVYQGEFSTGGKVSEGQRGFPVYVDDTFWFGLAHPSGWAIGSGDTIQLMEYPGVDVEPNATFQAMEAVIGAAARGKARAAFVRHVRNRCRRTRRNHDRPYAVYSNFGSWPLNVEGASWTENTEADCLHSIARLEDAAENVDCHFDLCSIDFWVDSAGDLEQFDPQRFPDGLERIRAELEAVGTAPGLWIDSSMGGWSIGDSPAVQGTFVHNPEYPPHFWCKPFMCRATEPIRSLYRTAFLHHIRENGVRHLKFDNLRSYCVNTRHDHLPGRFSTKAIHDGVIEALTAFDAACPEVFIFLYWGYRSPWWLLHGDVLFEPGLDIEAATPSAAPTLYIRDGVTVGLDQAQHWCRDLPPLGKDSLGVWLSDWAWNSCIGTERWEEAFVLDLCRGSLLAQPWSDRDFLDDAGRRQMALFLKLLRVKPGCFANPQFILGDPWASEPYGYCCSDGAAAFVAINNCTWQDTQVSLQLDRRWGLPTDKKWDVYRWYPKPAKLETTDKDEPILAMRPFDVVLLEVVPAGNAPALPMDFDVEPMVSRFKIGTHELTLDLQEPAATAAPQPTAVAEPDGEPPAHRSLTIETQIRATAGPVLVCIAAEVFDGTRLLSRRNPGRWFAASATLDGDPIPADPVLREQGYPAGWQAWRMAVPASDKPRNMLLTTTVVAEDGHKLRVKGYAIPRG